MSSCNSGREGALHSSKVTIIVDDREIPGQVYESLLLMPEVSVQVRRLALGDYEVEGQCLFERKSLADFAASLVDGRLLSQAARLARSSFPTAIILEGRSGDLAGCQVRREALQGAMVTLSIIFRLPILRSFNPDETARLLLYAGSQLREQDTDCSYRWGYRPHSLRRQKLHVLQGLPGIGQVRAAQLLDAFGSVEAVMKASLEQLEKIDGFGPRTCQAIRKVLE